MDGEDEVTRERSGSPRARRWMPSPFGFSFALHAAVLITSALALPFRADASDDARAEPPFSLAPYLVAVAEREEDPRPVETLAEAAPDDRERVDGIGLHPQDRWSDPHAPTTPWARDDALGNDPESVRGNLWGSAIGDAFGSPGVGLGRKKLCDTCGGEGRGAALRLPTAPGGATGTEKASLVARRTDQSPQTAVVVSAAYAVPLGVGWPVPSASSASPLP